MKHRILILTALLLSFAHLGAQELNCKVSVNSDQVQTTDKSIYEDMQKALTSFMNDRQWTEYEYQVNERIECSIYLIITNSSSNRFTGELQVQATRPVFNSAYKSPIFSFNDKNISFSYSQNEQLNFDINSFDNNLACILAYYAYIIIGTDCDSFSKYGGTSFYQKAEQIVNQAQGTSESGWKAFEDNHNRYALINSILEDIARPYREYFYIYHRQGLDQMTQSADKSRTLITDGLPRLKEIYKSRPSCLIISEFTETKINEIVNIYSKATTDQRKIAYDTFSYIAPTMRNQLDSLK